MVGENISSKKDLRGSEPIFIVGTGRSGSTIFQKVVAEHPKLSWFSYLLDMYPNKPYLNRILMRVMDIPGVRDILYKKVNPGEYYNFWDYYFSGFSTSCRDLESKDVAKNVKKDIREVFSQIPTKKRDRILVKLTGWPRIGFLNEIFPDAKFIHFVRDGRAVSHSLLNVGFWEGWDGSSNWRWGELTEWERKKWEDHEKSFVGLAAIEWRKLIKAVEKSKDELRDAQYIEIKYENFVSNPKKILKNVTNFCNLEYLESFNNRIEKYNLENRNYKWKKNFTTKQKKVLMDILNDYLKKYKYI
ncbi:MAG: sulfotransferase family protein [Thermoplasmatota archaeon]